MAVLPVNITKGKANLDVDTDKLPEHVYREAMIQGLKVLLNRGMTKITTAGLTGQQLEDAKAAALAKANENLEAVYSGKIRIMGAKADKVSGEVNTEAMRLARALVKDEMKKKNIKVSYVAAKEISAYAKAFLATDAGKTILEQAKANIEERKAAVATVAAAGLDVTTMPIDEKKKAKAEKEKAEKASQLSAKQAGKPKARKGQTVNA